MNNTTPAELINLANCIAIWGSTFEPSSDAARELSCGRRQHWRHCSNRLDDNDDSASPFQVDVLRLPVMLDASVARHRSCWCQRGTGARFKIAGIDR